MERSTYKITNIQVEVTLSWPTKGTRLISRFIETRSFQKRGKKLKYKCKIERLKYNPYIELIIKNNDQTETLQSAWDDNSKISNRASYESLLKENRVIGLRLGSFWPLIFFSRWLCQPIKRSKMNPWKGERKISKLISYMRGNEYSINITRSFQQVRHVNLNSLFDLCHRLPPSGQWHDGWW